MFERRGCSLRSAISGRNKIRSPFFLALTVRDASAIDTSLNSSISVQYDMYSISLRAKAFVCSGEDALR